MNFGVTKLVLMGGVLFLFTQAVIAQQTTLLQLLAPDSVEVKPTKYVTKLNAGYSQHEGMYNKALLYLPTDTNMQIGQGDTIYWRPNEKRFFCNVDTVLFVVESHANFYKYYKSEEVAGMGFDLGIHYNINDVRYFLYKDKIVFILFITESFTNYTVVASFNQSDLLNTRKIYLECCYTLNSGSLNNDCLILNFAERTGCIHLEKDLERTDIGYEKEMREKYRKK